MMDSAQTEGVESNPLLRSRRWILFVAVMLSCQSVMVALTGVGLAFVWAPIIVAVILFRLAAALKNPDTSERQTLERLRLYFKWQGILLISMVAMWCLIIFSGIIKIAFAALMTLVTGIAMDKGV